MKPRIGFLLLEKDADHLGIPTLKDPDEDNLFDFIKIQEDKPIQNQGPFDVILHKVSDYIKPERNGDKNAARILNEIKNNIKISRVCIDSPDVVLNLADRSQMFSIMEKCEFCLGSISVNVPKWKVLSNNEDLAELKNSKPTYPLICKALCAGEGDGCHAMELVFNDLQLENIRIFPSVAQEFKNHDGEMVKIFVYGPKYAILTRPSVRNFPVNGFPLEKTESIVFNSHDVAKTSSRSFLNNYQCGYVEKNSLLGDKILDESVVKELLHKISLQISFTFLGVDILVTDQGSTYYLVDINYIPSYSGVSCRSKLLSRVLCDFLKNKKHVNYWS